MVVVVSAVVVRVVVGLEEEAMVVGVMVVVGSGVEERVAAGSGVVVRVVAGSGVVAMVVAGWVVAG
jgi:hypothetical protein